MSFPEIIVSAFIIGLAGSIHCVGMCGPIMLALPFDHDSWFNRFISNLIYFTGKALTYALMGFAIGLMGAVVFPKQWQQWVSIGSGVLILVMTWIPKLFKSNSTSAFQAKVVQSMQVWMKKRGLFAQFILGGINGLLPCGLVYVALAASVSAGGVLRSGLFMFIFGIGTMPLLFLIGISRQTLGFKFRNTLSKAIPYVATVLALLFILRGLSLGIPFISPDMEKMSKMELMQKSNSMNNHQMPTHSH
jgi:uncharacterized protein